MRGLLMAGVVAAVVAGCAQDGIPPIDPSPPSATVTTTTSTTAAATSTIPAGPTTTSTIATTTTTGIPEVTEVVEYPVPGSRPHDVAVAPDGRVWYTAQRSGSLDRLDPVSGEVTQVPLGSGSAPHGVIVGPGGDAWVTDQGLNALVRVNHETLAVDVFTAEVPVVMHTPAVGPDGTIWFTGQGGYYGWFDPGTEEMAVFESGGGGPYGITVTPGGNVYFAALEGSYLARVDPVTAEMTRIDPPTPDQGARRVWSDSEGSIWVAYWNTGHLARYAPATGEWTEWKLPGEAPQAYAVYVDETDRPWVSDFGGDHALLRFDVAMETFESFPLPTPRSGVRQILGRPGEVWGAESAADALVVVRYGG